MIIGITGQTGAGKSTVCRDVAQSGAAVVDADVIARAVIESESVKTALAEAFGDDILSGGNIDRRLLAKRAFSSRENTDRLNGIMHPPIIEKMLSAAQSALKNGAVAAIFDAPQLFESGLDKYCDAVVAVTADASVRKKRIIERDGLTQDQADDRLKAALPDSFFKSRCDFSVCTDSGDPKSAADMILNFIGERRAELEKADKSGNISCGNCNNNLRRCDRLRQADALSLSDEIQ